MCWYRILSAFDLHVEPQNFQKYYSLSMGPWEYPEWCGVTRSDTKAPKVPFSSKMTKMPLVNPRLINSQTKSKSPQNSTFHSFTSNPRFLEIFGDFWQVWPEVDSQRAPNFVRPSKWVETNVILKIIKFSVQRLFISQNWSWNGQDLKTGLTHRSINH